MDTDNEFTGESSGVRRRLYELSQSGRMSDVCFVVGFEGTDRVQIPAHKLILSISSPVFYEMFHGPLAEKGEIEITDIEPEAFKAMLKYLYTDVLEVEAEFIASLAYCAKKYLLTELSEDCLVHLKSKLTVENALSILDQCVLLKADDMASECLKVIGMTASFVLALDSFTEINLETLKRILEHESLQAPEITIFESAWRWAKAECRRSNHEETDANCRQSLADALFLIRFPVMSSKDFATIPAQSGLLTKDEIVDIFIFNASDVQPALKFPIVPRTFSQWKQCERVKLWDFAYESAMRKIDSANYNSTRFSAEILQFAASKRVFVTGFEFFIHPTIHLNNSINSLTFQCQLRCSENVLQTTNVTVDNFNKPIPATFPVPVFVQANKFYSLSLQPLPAQLLHLYCSANGQQSATVDSVIFEFKCGSRSSFSFLQNGVISKILFHEA